ncbi:MAG TPA: sulfatase-like hydrolase/transferase [Bryobacteraceae bacterium]|nr:sulfatase-like hydrolase/transferase [Bryobacteraceae bacterium]
MNETISRRDVLRSGALAAAAPLGQAPQPKNKPNIVVIISDQFRADCIGAAGSNPMGLTPNLDKMARRGIIFQSAMCSQPVCAPTRASIFTGQYPEKHGVWKNGIPLRENATTIATVLREAGYSANYIGKWHLGKAGPGPVPGHEHAGPVPAPERGGFLDLWEAANELEWTSHAYEGDLYDTDNRVIPFSGTYRADFLTERARRFLQNARAPFFLVLSYLEVHHQNDIDQFVPPKEYKGKFQNPFVPGDLRPLPGSWQEQLPDYYGCVKSMDDQVGAVNQMLAEHGFADNTIVVFLSDHGCHFKTRNTEYKRSPHESSIHVPLIIQGPPFDRGLMIPELVSHVDLAPTLLQAAGLGVPASMQGHSFLPLLDRKTEGWRNEVYLTMSEFMTGRILRTPEWTYAVAAPKDAGWKSRPAADEYFEYLMYNLPADPFQHVNLAGRSETRDVAKYLHERLLARIEEASGVRAKIGTDLFPYS